MNHTTAQVKSQFACNISSMHQLLPNYISFYNQPACFHMQTPKHSKLMQLHLDVVFRFLVFGTCRMHSFHCVKWTKENRMRQCNTWHSWWCVDDLAIFHERNKHHKQFWWNLKCIICTIQHNWKNYTFDFNNMTLLFLRIT